MVYVVYMNGAIFRGVEIDRADMSIFLLQAHIYTIIEDKNIINLVNLPS